MTERWDRVTSLFGAARALDPQRRQVFLEIACEGDDQLRSAVEELLSTDTEEDGFLEDPPWSELGKGLIEKSIVAGQVLKDRYRLQGELAAGGQAQVYRATDELLNRSVVIKLMQGRGPGKQLLKSRFEHEMKALAHIDHPGVVGILDVGELEDGRPFLVIQHIPGISLREAISQGPISGPRAAAILRQIGAALEAAHSLGIAHRDLKPENIMLQQLNDGTELVKLIDFGLAKVEKSTSAANPSTMVLAGTIRYMAPEQFQGENSTASDIYAFGLIACEVTSGRTDPYALELPLPARDLVRSALAYQPQDRPRSASQFSAQLVEALAEVLESHAPQVSTGATVPTPRRARIAWLVAALLLASVTAGLVALRGGSSDTQAVDLSLAPPESTTFRSSALSPDGRRIAVVAADSSGRTQLWLRTLASPAYQSMPESDGASFPFWSPDSRHIGFFANGKLKKVDVSGGPVQTICSAESGSLGGAWSHDGVILFTLNPSTPLYRVSANGGEPVPVTALDTSRGESSHVWPQFLADGRHFLFFVTSAEPDVAGIYAGSLDAKERQRVLASRSNGWYVSGHLLFLRDQTLVAQPFDTRRLQISGEAVPVAEKVGVIQPLSHSLFSVSDSGVLAYSSDPGTYSQLLWFDRSGQRLGAASSGSPKRSYTNVDLSANGTHLAADARDALTGNRVVWLFDLARGGESRLTFGASTDASPVWSPDNRHVIFFSVRDGTWNLYKKAASGAGDDELLLKSKLSKITCDWSVDGRFIVYREWIPETKWDLWVLPVDGDRKPFGVVRTPSEDRCGQVSPDGRWLAYSAGEPGQEEVYIQPFAPGPTAGGRWQISTNGGDVPRWRGDGKELFYLGRDLKIMAVALRSSTTIQFGPPQPLFQTHAEGFLRYDVTADGRRFLVNTSAEEPPPSLPTIRLNWTSVLQR